MIIMKCKETGSVFGVFSPMFYQFGRNPWKTSMSPLSFYFSVSYPKIYRVKSGNDCVNPGNKLLVHYDDYFSLSCNPLN